MNNSTVVFAFEDDYAMGILTSHTHSAWAWAQGSTLKGDLRYTPSSVFGTFPWPYPVSNRQRRRVANASKELLTRRTQICTAEDIGLTKLYNSVEEGAWTEILDLHKELDHAVADCYGWSRSISQNAAETVRQLIALNVEIARGARDYDPFAGL